MAVTLRYHTGSIGMPQHEKGNGREASSSAGLQVAHGPSPQGAVLGLAEQGHEPGKLFGEGSNAVAGFPAT
jgi:hypothetical protein